MTFNLPDTYSISVGIKDYCGIRVLTCKLDTGSMRQDFFKLVTDNRNRSYNFTVFTTNSLFVNIWNGDCKVTLRSYPMVAALYPTFKV
jgi:hypothetical protein